jgi:hypothetical protein
MFETHSDEKLFRLFLLLNEWTLAQRAYQLRYPGPFLNWGPVCSTVHEETSEDFLYSAETFTRKIRMKGPGQNYAGSRLAACVKPVQPVPNQCSLKLNNPL